MSRIILDFGSRMTQKMCDLSENEVTFTPHGQSGRPLSPAHAAGEVRFRKGIHSSTQSSTKPGCVAHRKCNHSLLASATTDAILISEGRRDSWLASDIKWKELRDYDTAV